MKFKLTTSGNIYKYKKNRIDLEKLGFTFKRTYLHNRVRYFIEGEPEIEFNSLEELIKFSNIHGVLIICNDRIEIYDNNREL